MVLSNTKNPPRLDFKDVLEFNPIGIGVYLKWRIGRVLVVERQYLSNGPSAEYRD